MRRSRSLLAAVALALVASVLGACAPDVPPPNLTRISPDDGTGYVTPRISADGNLVVYRREADQDAPWYSQRDLVVTNVGAGTTQVFPSVTGIVDMSDDGRYITHQDVLDHVWRLDTTTGAQDLVAEAGPDEQVDGGEMSADGTTIWLRTTLWSPTGNCPCTYTTSIWRDGSIVLTVPALDLFDDLDFGRFVGPSPDGSAVFVHQVLQRRIVRVDIPSGTVTALPLTFPDLPSDWGVYGSESSWLSSREYLEADATDGSAFRLRSGDHTYRLTPSGTTEVPQISAARSPNLRWSAEVTSTEVRPSVDRLDYVVTDHANASARIVATTESSPPTIYPTFTVDASVADTGRVAIGRWSPQLSGEWPPSAIYIDG